jgi:hypothetical protein
VSAVVATDDAVRRRFVLRVGSAAFAPAAGFAAVLVFAAVVVFAAARGFAAARLRGGVDSTSAAVTSCSLSLRADSIASCRFSRTAVVQPRVLSATAMQPFATDLTIALNIGI